MPGEQSSVNSDVLSIQNWRDAYMHVHSVKGILYTPINSLFIIIQQEIIFQLHDKLVTKYTIIQQEIFAIFTNIVCPFCNCLQFQL